MSEMTTAIESPQRSDAEVEGAMALLGSGISSNQVSEITGIPARTLRDWGRSPELATKYREAIKQARIRISLRTSQLAEQVLDDIEDGTVKVSPLQAMTMWGIATDKIQKDEPQHDGKAPVVSVFVGVQIDGRDKQNVTVSRRPASDDGEIIEGAAREVEPSG